MKPGVSTMGTATSCNPGYFLDTASKNCAMCSYGQWSAGGTATTCTMCLPGKYGTMTGGTSAAMACHDCPIGTWSSQAGAPTDQSCSNCPMGRYGTEAGLGSLELCSQCPAGTYNNVAGSTSSDACLPCAPGTFSSQIGASVPEACTSCIPGRWNANQGGSSLSSCSMCPAGTYSGTAGAISSAVCLTCPAGKWSSLAGASLATNCMNCPPGTWSGNIAAPSQSTCALCNPGRWSSTSGASSVDTCTNCPAGKYQWAWGQANVSSCIDCAPGNFSYRVGRAACSQCPAGSYAQAFGSTACTLCAPGRYTYGDNVAAVNSDACFQCYPNQPNTCLGGNSEYLKIVVSGLQYSLMNSAQQQELKQAIVTLLESELGSYVSVFKDLFGNNNTVTITQGSTIIEAYVWPLKNTSASTLAAVVYDQSFASAVMTRINQIVQYPDDSAIVGWMEVQSISLKPKQFVKVTPTEVPRSTRAPPTAHTTTAMTMPPDTTAAAALEETTTVPSDSSSSLPVWVWALIGLGTVFGLAGLAGLLVMCNCFSKSKKTLRKAKRELPVATEEGTMSPLVPPPVPAAGAERAGAPVAFSPTAATHSVYVVGQGHPLTTVVTPVQTYMPVYVSPPGSHVVRQA